MENWFAPKFPCHDITLCSFRQPFPDNLDKFWQLAVKHANMIILLIVKHMICIGVVLRATCADERRARPTIQQ